MENKEPTKEQIQKFWEHFGFEQIDYLDTSGNVCAHHYAHPDAPGGGCTSLPPIDLNNIDKYARPELNTQGIGIEIYLWTNGFCKVRLYDVGKLKNQHEVKSSVESKIIVLALFWAIWEIIKE